jgi:hypothetical protein
MATPENKDGAAPADTDPKKEKERAKEERKAKTDEAREATRLDPDLRGQDERPRAMPRLRPTRAELLDAVNALVDEDAEFMLTELARRLAVPLGQKGIKGKAHTGKFIARVQLNVQPKGESKVRLVKPGDVVALENEDVERFLKKTPPVIEPELV